VANAQNAADGNHFNEEDTGAPGWAGRKPQEEEMAEAGSTLSRHDLEAKIVKRCWEDEAFRKEFTANPAGAFVKYLAVPAASLPRISIHQEEPGSWHIVLPAKPARSGELSERELERIAGGITDPALLSVVPAAVSQMVGISTGSIQTPVSVETPPFQQQGW
jgi:hypothetical protein